MMLTLAIVGAITAGFAATYALLWLIARLATHPWRGRSRMDPVRERFTAIIQSEATVPLGLILYLADSKKVMLVTSPVLRFALRDEKFLEEFSQGVIHGVNNLVEMGPGDLDK